MRKKLSWLKYRLQFKRPSGTSRGVLAHKDSYFLILQNGNKKIGIGECGLLRGLSVDDVPEYESQLEALCRAVNQGLDPVDMLYGFPSIEFGWEMVQKDFEAESSFIHFPSLFTEGKEQQAINGLIWMGNYEFMLTELRSRLEQGFHCIKMKIGAIDFEEEIALLRKIRNRFWPRRY